MLLIKLVDMYKNITIVTKRKMKVGSVLKGNKRLN